jgi:hypothetical protein
VVKRHPDGVVKVRVKVNALPAPTLLMGVTVKVKVPEPPVGVPDIRPEEPVNESPFVAPVNEADVEKDVGVPVQPVGDTETEVPTLTVWVAYEQPVGEEGLQQ